MIENLIKARNILVKFVIAMSTGSVILTEWADEACEAAKLLDKEILKKDIKIVDDFIKECNPMINREFKKVIDSFDRIKNELYR